MVAMNMDLILGPVQIGNTVSTFLLGLITVQAYIYYQDYPTDPTGMKVLVAAIWLAELGNQLCGIYTVYFYTIKQFGNPSFLFAKSPATLDIFILFHGLTITLVSVFYIYRLWMNTRQRIVAASLGFLMTGRSALVLIIAGFAFKQENWVSFLRDTRDLLAGALITITVTEILLTLALCHDLYLQRQQPIYKTWRTIDRAIMWWITTGVFTSILAVVMTVTFLALRDKFVWLGFYIPLSRFFAIAFLASLNARRGLRDAGSFNTFQVEMATRPGHVNHVPEKVDDPSFLAMS